jgi:hypothetical protein
LPQANKLLVLTLILKNIIFSKTTPSTPVDIRRYFGGDNCLHLQGDEKAKQAKQKAEDKK